MLGKIATPTEMHFPASSKDGHVTRKMVFRNVTDRDMAVKLIMPTKSAGAVSLQHRKFRLEPRGVISIEVTVDYGKLGYAKSGHTMTGYARPMNNQQMYCIGNWMTQDGSEKPRQKAFQLQLKFLDSFSAYEIISKLLKHYMPGHASLIEPVSKAVSGIDTSDTRTAKKMEEGTVTARPFGSMESFLKEQAKLKQMHAKTESCWLVDMVSKFVTGAEPKVEKKEKKAVSKKEDRSSKSTKSGKSAKSGKSGKDEKKGPRNIRVMTTVTESRPGGIHSRTVETHSEYVNTEMNATPCGGN